MIGRIAICDVTRRRAIALLLAICVVASGLAALRHEATVAHVHAALSDANEHAHALAEFHELSTTPHLHGRKVATGADAGACALLAALGHATILPDAPTASAIARLVATTESPPFFITPAAFATYRLAPKTSPPALT